MKRPASSVLASPVKKAPRVDPIEEKCSAVLEALNESTVLPESIRGMLCNGLLGCLGVLRDQRHAYQETVVSWVGESLDEIEKTIQAVIEKAQADLAGADSEKVAREAAQSVAQESLDKAKETGSHLGEKLASDISALKEAARALADVQAAEEAGNAELLAASEEKDKLETMLKDTYAPLKEGSVVGAATKKLVTALVQVGKSLSFDASLIDSLPAALKKAPDARGMFDGIVLKQYEDGFAKRIAELDQLLAEGAPAKEARAAAVLDAQTAKDGAEEQKRTSTVALQEAQKAVKEGEAKLKTAKKAVGDLAPELEEAKMNFENASARLAAFREGPLAAFTELRDRSTPPPVEEEGACMTVVSEEAQADEGMPESKLEVSLPTVSEEVSAGKDKSDGKLTESKLETPVDEQEPVASPVAS